MTTTEWNQRVRKAMEGAELYRLSLTAEKLTCLRCATCGAIKHQPHYGDCPVAEIEALLKEIPEEETND